MKPSTEKNCWRISALFVIVDAVKSVSCKTIREEKSEQGLYRVVLMDFGYKRNIVRSLKNRGCDVTIVPSDTPAEEILAMKPDGIMLSNGPGDPEENVEIIAQIKSCWMRMCRCLASAWAIS